MSSKKIITYITQEKIVGPEIDQLAEQLDVEFKTLDSIHKLLPLLSNPKYCTDLIVIDIEKINNIEGTDMFNMVNTIQTLIACTVCSRTLGRPAKRTTVVAVAVDSLTDCKLIKEILDADVKGIYPRGLGFLFEEKESALTELLQGQYHVPKKINALFNKKKTVKRVEYNSEINLTPRQEQIANLISTRGASNKVIAKVLGIAESTVKLHMSAILKKYGVKNRTQLAVFAKETIQ